MYKDDGLTEGDMAALLRAFPAQTLDFFGALRASTYDNQIREWIKADVVKGDISGAGSGSDAGASAGAGAGAGMGADVGAAR